MAADEPDKTTVQYVHHSLESQSDIIKIKQATSLQ